ncbi:MAG: aminotransferase class V-fold PLP-dependent enzyme [Kofleriaceae bacterium]
MSTNPRIYLDFNATAPLLPSARDAIAAAMAGGGGNPSSVHSEGRKARDHVEQARNDVAALLGRPREQIVLTSGGTEANAVGVAALAAAAIARGLPRVAVTRAIGHPSLLGAIHALAAQGWEVRIGDRVDGAGLVGVSAVNHELGLVDTETIPAARVVGALVHVDAVQAAGKRSLVELDADAIAISAHKLGGPQGSGAVVLGPVAGDPPAFGHQERGRRGGTENTLGIVGFGAAARAVELAAWPAVAALGDRLEAGLVALGARINGGDQPRIGGTINAAFPGARGESIVIALDLAGIAVSTGAACTSGSVQPSPVLLALGQTADQAREAVRFSLGRTTTAAEIDRVLAVLPDLVERARRHTR